MVMIHFVTMYSIIAFVFFCILTGFFWGFMRICNRWYQNYYQIPDEEFKKFKDERLEDVKADILRRKTALFLIENNN